MIVEVSDGILTDTQALAVTVTNQNEAPTITSNGGGATAALSIAENSTAVTTVVATDVDAGAVLTYALAGGADAAKFAIDETTGVLTFIAAPDFDVPGDVGGNNVYDVIVQASDGTLVDTQALAVTVTNVNEAPVIQLERRRRLCSRFDRRKQHRCHHRLGPGPRRRDDDDLYADRRCRCLPSSPSIPRRVSLPSSPRRTSSFQATSAATTSTT